MNQVPNVYLNLNDQQQFKLKKPSEIRDYFILEIRDRELLSIKLSKYIASFDYFDKSLIFLPGTTGEKYIA